MSFWSAKVDDPILSRSKSLFQIYKKVILSNNSSCNNCKKKAADPFGMNRLKEPNGVAIESISYNRGS